MNSLILGVNGQDGILLSRHLVAQGQNVFGIGVQNQRSPFLESSIKYIQANICETDKIMELVSRTKVEHIYNLAGLSSVAESFLNPDKSFEVNFHAVERILNSLYGDTQRNIRFFQASSSEMFGKIEVEPQDENTTFNPQSPYAEAKVRSHRLCSEFRRSGHFVTCGILFNHESVYRPTSFVSRKITSAVARISLGLQRDLTLGNLEATRDWGAARDYVQGMHQILQHDSPEDFVVATGIGHTVKDLAMVALKHVGLEHQFEELIKIDETLKRPIEIRKTLGNPQKIQNLLGWKAKTNFIDLINEMVDHDIALFKDSNLNH
jgi:GDPmannose 4,6-dehydratase